MENVKDLTALFKISYGLYVVTSNDSNKDNGLIVNSVMQITDNPKRVAVTINKANYSHDVIKESGKMNLNCISCDAPFKIFEVFGFQSGKDTDKFESIPFSKSENGLCYLNEYINSYMSLEVTQDIDFGTHTMFICDITQAKVINEKPSMTYAYYHENVKPKPDTKKKKGYVCKICGYVYEGEVLPDDFICPLCKHGASDFEPITE